MGRRKRKEPILLENIKIIDTASKGKSVAKHDGKTIFVQAGIPGDICDIKVFKRKKKFWQANIERYIPTLIEEPSLNVNTLEYVGVANGRT